MLTGNPAAGCLWKGEVLRGPEKLAPGTESCFVHPNININILITGSNKSTCALAGGKQVSLVNYYLK